MVGVRGWWWCLFDLTAVAGKKQRQTNKAAKRRAIRSGHTVQCGVEPQIGEVSVDHEYLPHGGFGRAGQSPHASWPKRAVQWSGNRAMKSWRAIACTGTNTHDRRAAEMAPETPSRVSGLFPVRQVTSRAFQGRTVAVELSNSASSELISSRSALDSHLADAASLFSPTRTVGRAHPDHPSRLSPSPPLLRTCYSLAGEENACLCATHHPTQFRAIGSGQMLPM